MSRARPQATGARRRERAAAGEDDRPLTTAELRRRLRQTGGRGRKLRGLAALLRPYRTKVILMFVALAAATAATLAPPPLIKLAIDDGIEQGDLGTLNLVVVAFVAAALVFWGASYAQTYLVGWVGQRALQDLRLRIFSHLQSLPVGFYERRQAGPAHLAHDQRRAGAGLARHRQRRDAVSELADAHRHDGRSSRTSTSSSRC